MMETKVIRGGKVAVLYSPGYGAGWSTWNCDTDSPGQNIGMENFLLFDPTLVKLVENDERDRIPRYVESVYPEAYTGGADNLSILWISQGTAFKVTEYDGDESIEIREHIDWKVA